MMSSGFGVLPTLVPETPSGPPTACYMCIQRMRILRAHAQRVNCSCVTHAAGAANTAP